MPDITSYVFVSCGGKHEEKGEKYSEKTCVIEVVREGIRKCLLSRGGKNCLCAHHNTISESNDTERYDEVLFRHIDGLPLRPEKKQNLKSKITEHMVIKLALDVLKSYFHWSPHGSIREYDFYGTLKYRPELKKVVDMLIPLAEDAQEKRINGNEKDTKRLEEFDTLYLIAQDILSSEMQGLHREILMLLHLVNGCGSIAS